MREPALSVECERGELVAQPGFEPRPVGREPADRSPIFGHLGFPAGLRYLPAPKGVHHVPSVQTPRRKALHAPGTAGRQDCVLVRAPLLAQLGRARGDLPAPEPHDHGPDPHLDAELLKFLRHIMEGPTSSRSPDAHLQ